MGQGRAAPLCPPTLLRMGFTQPPCLQDAGELLPRHFNLATALSVSAVCFCCTFPIVTYAGRYHGILALRSPDFPHALRHATVWPAQVMHSTMKMDLYQFLIQLYMSMVYHFQRHQPLFSRRTPYSPRTTSRYRSGLRRARTFQGLLQAEHRGT